MATPRVLSAGCSTCRGTIDMVKKVARSPSEGRRRSERHADRVALFDEGRDVSHVARIGVWESPLEQRVALVDSRSKTLETVSKPDVRVKDPAQLARCVSAAQPFLDRRQHQKTVEAFAPVARQHRQ